ncbi:MAG: phenylacetate--CoA ligase family protein, partial [Epsilonproteobacteria bacterium]|nr:phenylacetate--CoA ligase family protein [Campylobacterota bacterium]
HEDLETTIDFFHCGMRCLVDERDKVMVLLPGPSFASIGDLLKKALQRSGIECIVHGVLDDVEAAAACIFQNGITAIVGIPMQVSYLARMKKELFDTHIKKVLLSTDYVADALVKSLSRNGTCQVFNHYGMTEMGYGGGVECACLSGYHLRENDLYFEIVDPMTGKVVEDGTYGEVVFTTLNRQAMPLIRYKTGDRARFLVETCACGTFLRRMEKVRGRIENTLSVEGHEITLRDLDEIFLAYESLMDYRVECYDPNRLHVRLVLDKNTDAKAFQNALKQELHVRFQSKFDFEIEIEEDDRSSKITRSMIKRKIHDCRQGAKR